MNTCSSRWGRWEKQALNFKIQGSVSLRACVSRLILAECQRFGLFLLLLLGFVAASHAQTLQSPAADSNQVAVDLEREVVLTKKLYQIRERINAAFQDDSDLPGRTEPEWEEYKRLLNLLANAYDTHLDALNKLVGAQQTRQDFQQKFDSWSGFSEPPPYSVDFVDDLWRQVRLNDHEYESARLEQAMIESLLESQRQSFQSSAQNMRKANESLETATPEQAQRARWLQELNALRNQHDEARVAVLDTEREVRKEHLAYVMAEKDLLQRKVLAASRSSPLTQVELNKKLGQLSGQQQSLELETQQAQQKEREADKTLQRTREHLRQARKVLDNGSAAGESAEVEKLQQILDADIVEVEVANANLKVLRLYANALVGQRHIWELRYRIDHAEDVNVFKTAEEDVQQGFEKMTVWREYLQADLETTRLRLDTVKNRLANWQSDYGDRNQELRKHVAYISEEALLRRVMAEGDDLDSRMRNLQQTLHWQREDAKLVDKFKRAYVEALELGQDLADFELLTIDDTLIAEGREIVGKRSVTVGKVLTMLVILGLGLWLINQLSARGYRRMRHWQSERASKGLLAIRLFSLLAVVGIVVFALVSVHIPLTVFTFFGGALAIGVGFGAQNIVNNFISGLILLTERSIKLGDIVEVDGVLSRVTQIGSRCCHVHRFDGIDMLIPNSSFLEKNVTNWTLSDQRLRCTVTVGASYEAPVRTAMALVKRAATEHPQVLQEPAPEVYLDAFGDNAFNLRLDFWVDLQVQSNRMRAMSDVRLRIEALLGEHGIGIAYPQRDVHLDIRQPVMVEWARTGAQGSNTER